ncbi:MAG: ACP S-malonyltransferase [bacterium]
MNDIFGFLFPGQGSQFVGMGSDIYERFPAARDVYERAEDVLELPIKRISFEGPEEELRQTRYTQPAILTHSLAVLAVMPEIRPIFAAGHSLGEYSALYAARCFDFNSVMKIVKRRADLMFAEGEKFPGAMAAIIGLNAVEVENICRDARGIVVCANYNEPRQTVISGEPEAVQQTMVLAKTKGALKVVALPVSGAFHSPLLDGLANEFAEYLESFEIHPPLFPVIMNVTGKSTTDVDEIRRNLRRQLVSPVRWVAIMETARLMGGKMFLEVGPGRVLSGLAKRIDREFVVTSLGKADDLERFLTEV